MPAEERKVAMKPFLRDAAVIAVLCGACLAYHAVLRLYLTGLDRPMVFELGFLMSLGLGFLYELKAGYRVGFAGCAFTGWVFVIGAVVARWFRDLYVEVVEQVRFAPEIADLIGHDLHAALSNRAVGYGGAFAVGLLVARLTFGANRPRAWFLRLLLGPSSSATVCQCCGQALRPI